MRLKNWLLDNWIWILLAVVAIVMFLFGLFFMTPERCAALDVILNTPLSEVKFWHFLLSMGLIIAIWSPRNSSK